MNVTWTDDQVWALGVKTDVETAGSIFNLSRTQAYLAVKEDRFPVPVVRVGRHLIVPVAPIRQLLGMERPGPQPRDPADNTTTTLTKGRHVNRTSAA